MGASYRARRARTGGRLGIFASTLGISGALLFGVVVQACGGDSKNPKTAANVVDGGPAASAVADTATEDHGGSVANPTPHADLEGDAKALYEQAYAAYKAGDLQGAKIGFRAASEKAPKAGAPHYSLGCVVERLGDASGAQNEYRQAFTVDPTFVVALGALGISLARNGHNTEAETLLGDQHKTNPDNVQILTYLAEVKSIAGGDAASLAAQKFAQEALSKDQKYVPAMLVIARDYFRQRRFDVAKAAIQAVLDGADDKSVPPRDPKNPDARLLRALIAREQGDRKTALENFQLAVAERPDLFEAYVNIGEMKLEAGNASESQAPLEKAVKYSPNSAIAHLDLGDCYRLLNRAGDAKKEFDTVMAQDSSLAAVHYNLALLYLYSTAVPGAPTPDDQVALSIAELEKFKQMRGKLARGQADDADELLSTAKRKQAELTQKKAAAAQASAAAAASAAAPPAASGSAAPAPSAAPSAGAPAP